MAVLVTGGAGFIGSHVAAALVAQGEEVVVLDDLSSGQRENVPAKARLVVASIDSAEADELIRAVRPKALFHHAAHVSVRRSVEEPLFYCDVNVRGTLRVAQSAAAAGCTTFVLASSGGTVYGEPECMPVPENHPLRPVCPYGVSKCSAEAYADFVGRTTGMRSVSLRYGNVYGPGQDPHGEAGVVAIFSNMVIAGQALTINGDGEQTRDYVHVADVVRANLLAWRTPQARGPFNVGTGVSASVLDIAKLVSAALGVPRRFVHGPAKAGEQRHISLSFERAARVLGWRPEKKVADGVAETARWFASRARADEGAAPGRAIAQASVAAVSGQRY